MEKIPNKKDAMDAVETLVRYIEKDGGELREGLVDTPKRVVDSFDELYNGYTQDADSLLDATFNAEGYDGIVLLRDIEFHSTCEHHMLPFTGSAHIAYIPNERVVGLSKLGRVVDVFSKRLQTQERLTLQIAKSIMTAIDAKGVAVTIDAAHQCMTTRGIKKEKASTVTNYYLGQFKDDLSVQNRYLRLISQ